MRLQFFKYFFDYEFCIILLYFRFCPFFNFPRQMEWNRWGLRKRCNATVQHTTLWTSTMLMMTHEYTCTNYWNLRILVATDCLPLSVAWRKIPYPTPSLTCTQVCMALHVGLVACFSPSALFFFTHSFIILIFSLFCFTEVIRQPHMESVFSLHFMFFIIL